VNLRPCLEATAPAWQARLAELYERNHFILGEQVASFEREFASALGAKFGVGVGTGTAALELALRDSSVRGEVITSAVTAPFTATAILAAGCTPKFADVDPETMLMDAADALGRANRKTAAFMPVHLYGRRVDVEPFVSSGKLVVQDACQAHGLKDLARQSKYVAYSFYPTKNLGCLGDGGAVLTNDSAAAKRLSMLRDGGRRPGTQIADVAGINSRLDEMQACYLRAFLPRLEGWNEHRQRIAAFYDEALRDCPGVRLLRRDPESVQHLYVIRARGRDKLREHLAKSGIGSGVHYAVPLHLHRAFKHCGQRRGDLPHAEKACREILSLPVWPYMPLNYAERVADTIRLYYRS
jgi:dTDP-4-amino-4,6-dideoxygalactose transaminase